MKRYKVYEESEKGSSTNRGFVFEYNYEARDFVLSLCSKTMNSFTYRRYIVENLINGSRDRIEYPFLVVASDTKKAIAMFQYEFQVKKFIELQEEYDKESGTYSEGYYEIVKRELIQKEDI